jgi:hypothetical protein
MWAADLRLVTRDAVAGVHLSELSGVVSAAFGPTGLIATSAPDGRLEFREPRALAVVGQPVTGIAGPIEQYAYSAEGRLLAVRVSDGGVWLVDVGARHLLGGPIPLIGPAEGLAVRPDGAELAVGSAAGVTMWNLRPAAWAEAACTAAGRQLTETEWRDHVGDPEPAPTCG